MGLEQNWLVRAQFNPAAIWDTPRPPSDLRPHNHLLEERGDRARGGTPEHYERKHPIVSKDYACFPKASLVQSSCLRLGISLREAMLSRALRPLH